MRIRSTIVVLAGAFALSGCSGLKDALTAHTDVAAEAANAELSATRLGSLLGNARIGIEPSAENARIVAELWADYQRLGLAAAKNDSLMGNVDAALKPIFDNMRVSMMIDTLRSKIPGQVTDPEAAYNSGAAGFIAARHILFGFPQSPTGQPATPAQKDSVRRVAMGVLPQLTNANFGQMAKRYSSDPGSKDNGGLYPPFAKTDMVPEFSAGVEAVKPGEINKNLVETTYGFHIIQRPTYATVKTEYDQMFPRIQAQGADSAITANLMNNGKIEVKTSSAAAIKEAMKNPGAHKKDRTVVSTFKGGEMTVGQFLGWVDVMPGQTRGQVMQIVPTWPDTQVNAFTKNLTMRQLLLHKADSAKVDIPAAEKENLKVQFNGLVQQTWMQLGLSPKELADSGKTDKDRARIAAARVDSLMSRIMNGEANPVGVQMPVKAALDVGYKAEINSAGIERAVEAARKVRASADSARMSQPSSVPIPGAGGPPPAAGGPPPTE
ncbi:MAG TPA: peptidylprolyl isomerase [Gemmatimonadaceae bacterium]|nr:peptidylprolyl isomerase [Gemmatimonadaceae bacterium]